MKTLNTIVFVAVLTLGWMAGASAANLDKQTADMNRILKNRIDASIQLSEREDLGQSQLKLRADSDKQDSKDSLNSRLLLASS